MTDRWTNFFLDIAHRCADMSKDPSTKVGAVIVRPDKTIASLGFNGFPRMTCDDPAIYTDRDEKLRRVIHAEMNGILSAREPLHGYSIYSTHFPCARCAGAIIQAGITTVVAPHVEPRFHERWGNDIRTAQMMFSDADVGMCLVEQGNG